MGNRSISTINGVTTAYGYDNNDQLLTAGAINYQYNANGSLIQENDDGTITDYTYNKKNELTQLTTDTNNYQYQYDPMGIRNQATINGQTTEYLIDHNQTYAQVLLETSPTAQTIYTYGDDLLAQENSTGIHYYQYDGLGSTRQLSDTSQAITDSYFYDAFGNLLNETGTTENNYLYTGEQFDPNMGFYYLRARYMNPEVGRFTSMDTFSGFAATPITLNKYLYANASPINTTDPSGNFGIAEFSVAHKVRGILAEQQQILAFTLLDAAIDPENAEASLQNGLLLGVVAGSLGPAFKLLKFLSRKFRRTCNSFAFNTLISTEFGFKDISEIQIGEKVWAFNQKQDTIELQEVIHTIEGQELKATIDITLSSGEIIQATNEHPIYVSSNGLWNWINIEDLNTDMQLLNKDGQSLTINNIENNSTLVRVYNLTVANGHTYYVSNDEILVHNGSVCKFPKFDTAAKNHILRGSISSGGRVSGYHHRFGGVDSGSIKLVKIIKRGAGSKGGNGGTYEGVVRFVDRNGRIHKKSSTFFPNNWKPNRVISEINSAIASAATKGKLNGKIREKSTSGILIEMRIRDGILKTAFPILR